MGTSASLATIWRAIERLQFTIQKMYVAERRLLAPQMHGERVSSLDKELP